MLPDFGEVHYTNAVQELSFHKFKPDVTAYINGERLFFEVFVTHKVEADKEDFYLEGKYKSVEINLQGYSFESMEALEREILENVSNKRIIYWQEVKEVKSNNSDWFYWLIFGVLAYFGLKQIYSRRN